MTFRVVQPWGPDKGRQGTVQSEHKTVAEAFAALDSIATEMAHTGVPSDAIKALEMALKRRCPEAGLLHHSDQAARTRAKTTSGSSTGGASPAA